jgi:hypothetical protein
MIVVYSPAYKLSMACRTESECKEEREGREGGREGGARKGGGAGKEPDARFVAVFNDPPSSMPSLSNPPLAARAQTRQSCVFRQSL